MCYFLIVTICFLFKFSVIAQSWITIEDQISYALVVKREYGRDQSLVNGLQFSTENLVSFGHPYLGDPGFMKGWITIKGQQFDSVNLKYDLDRQKVELKYSTIYGGDNHIITVADFIDSFLIGETKFHRLEIEGGRPEFYQVIKTTHFDLYVFWRKKQQEISGVLNGIYYSPEEPIIYLDNKQGEVRKIRWPIGFARQFPHMKKELRAYFRRTQFQFKSTSPAGISLKFEILGLLMDVMNTS